MAIYYVDAATGDDADTGLTEALAWLTIDKAMNTVVAGDKVWIKGGTDYTELVTIDTAGSLGSWIEFEGYASTIGDGGSFTIDAESTRANCITTALGGVYYRFLNMLVENATSVGISGTSGDFFHLTNCEINNNGSYGIHADNANILVDCSISTNTIGVNLDNGMLVGCTFTGNSLDGVRVNYGGSFINCVSDSDSRTGIHSGSGGVFVNCTVDGDSKDTSTGIHFGTSDTSCIINNIAYDCDVGINCLTAGFGGLVVRNNLLNSNTTNYGNIIAAEQATDITSAPGFIDEATQDYRLAEGSAARNAGADASGTSSPGMDIGAHQAADPRDRVVITG